MSTPNFICIGELLLNLDNVEIIEVEGEGISRIIVIKTKSSKISYRYSEMLYGDIMNKIRPTSLLVAPKRLEGAL